MVSQPVRMALVGAGRVSARYLEVFRDELTDVAQLVGICELLPEKAQPFVEALGVPVVGDFDALADLQPELVCVLTESGNHYKNCIALLERDLNLVVEKPVALRLDQAIQMRDEAARRGRIMAVVKQNRYNPAMRFLRRVVDDKRIGKLVTAGIRVHWSRDQGYYDDPWHGRWLMDGGVLAQQAIHHVDALQWLGGPIEAVCAAGDNVVNELEAEDTAVAVVRFASGAFGTIEATTAARPRDFEASLHLVGDKAVAKVGGRALNILETWEPVDPVAGDGTARDDHSQEVPTSYGYGHGPYLRDVIDRLRAGRTDVPIGVDEGMKSLQLLHALYASMESGGWVALADQPQSAKLGL